MFTFRCVAVRSSALTCKIPRTYDDVIRKSNPPGARGRGSVIWPEVVHWTKVRYHMEHTLLLSGTTIHCQSHLTAIACKNDGRESPSWWCGTISSQCSTTFQYFLYIMYIMRNSNPIGITSTPLFG
jgi:hypothetical protein